MSGGAAGHFPEDDEMKKLTTSAALAALLMSACAGFQARENVLMPAMKVAWINISKNVTLSGGYKYFGAEDTTFTGNIDASVDSHNLLVGLRYNF